jgi:RimJ/RimL family protein N-acetyltransferase
MLVGMVPDEQPELPGEQVTLRPFRPTDIDVVRSVANDPLIPLITTVPTSGSRADALAYVERQHERLRSGNGYSYAIAEAATGEAVGQIGLGLHDYVYGRATIGYWIAARWRRRGYVTAALRLMAGWAFTLDGIARLELFVEPWNEGSWRAAERAGFRREGLLRAWQEIAGERRDMYVYGRLEADLLTADLLTADLLAADPLTADLTNADQ